MKLNCIKGRAGSGKSRYISWQVKQAMDSGMYAYLIVPDQYTLQAERELIRHIDAPGLMQAEVLSFTRLADRVLETAGGSRLPYINQRGRAMAVSKLLLDNAAQLKAYGAYVRSPGFATQLATEISEFKRFDISPTQMMEAAETPQLADISLIFQQYVEVVGDRYIDSEDRMNMMIEKLPAAAFLSGACVFIDGFEMLTAQIYRLVAALLRQCAELNITFRLGGENDADAPIFATERKHLDRILAIARDEGAEAELVHLPKEGPWGGSRHGGGSLTHLERNLYALPYGVYEGNDGGVEIIYAASLEREIELCAANMRRLAMAGYRWRDMMLVCNDIGRYAALIKRAFARFAIPCFIDDKRSVDTHTFARYCIQLLACIRSGYSRSDVVRLIKTGFSPLDKLECDELENLCIINGTRWLGPAYAAHVESERFHELKEKLLANLYALETRLKGMASAGQMAEAFYTYLENSGDIERFQAFIDALEQAGDYDAAEVAVQVHEALCSVLQQAHDLMGDVLCSIAEFAGMVASGLEAEDAGVIPSTIDSVFCGSIERSRAGDIKAMFIVGINEGVLPGNISAAGLINEQQMEALKEKDIYLGHSSEERASEQELAIYTAVSKPSARLFLSCSLTNAEGRPISAYPLLEDIKRRLPGAPVHTPLSVGLPGHIGTFASTALPLAHAMRRQRAGARTEGGWADVYRAYLDNGAAPPAFERLDDYIGPSLARELYGRHMHASASRLERFMACPFRYFTDYGLRPQPRPEYGHNQLDSGNYYHSALQYLAEAVDDWHATDDAAIDSIVDGICDRLDDELLAGQYREDGREQLNAEVMRGNTKGAARAIALQMRKGGFKLKQAEMPFKYTHTLPTGETVQVEGIIDRVDEYEQDGRRYFRIIDYKSGSKSFDYSELYYGMSIQLPLYAAAVQEAMGAAPAGMFIMHIREGVVDFGDGEDVRRQRLRTHKLNGLVLSDEQIAGAMGVEQGSSDDIYPTVFTKGNKLKKGTGIADSEQMQRVIDQSRQHMETAAKGIYSGDSRPYPFVGALQSCQYCPYKPQCGYEDANNASRFTEKVSREQVLGGGEDD